MPKRIKLIGQRFGRLTVLEEAERKGEKSRWLCKCDCGCTTIVATSNLTSGHTKSCGCSRVDALRQTATKHGFGHTRLYNVWSLMRKRCSNAKCKEYADYGGRGISVCKEWQSSFESFQEWALSSGYKDGLTIDRIDNDGNYEPSNCRWVTMKKQCNNRRSNHYCEYKGEQYTIAELSEISGVSYEKLKQRIIKLKWPIEKAVKTP